MSAHTPGPWFLDEGESGRFFPHVVLGGDNPRAHWRLVINTCAGKNGGPEAECVANARLIAAAPELLAALYRLVTDDAQDDIEDPCGHSDRGEWARIHRSVIDVANAAIAKAVGK